MRSTSREGIPWLLDNNMLAAMMLGLLLARKARPLTTITTTMPRAPLPQRGEESHALSRRG